MTALAHRLRVWYRARGIGRVRRRLARALASLGCARPREWVEFTEVAAGGHPIRQRLRVNPAQHSRITTGDWTPRRELAVRGWE